MLKNQPKKQKKKEFFIRTYQFTIIFFYEIQKERIFIQKINQK